MFLGYLQCGSTLVRFVRAQKSNHLTQVKEWSTLLGRSIFLDFVTKTKYPNLFQERRNCIKGISARLVPLEGFLVHTLEYNVESLHYFKANTFFLFVCFFLPATHFDCFINLSFLFGAQFSLRNQTALNTNWYCLHAEIQEYSHSTNRGRINHLIMTHWAKRC